MKHFIVIGVFAMALGVVLGAFGAHGLKDKIAPNLLSAFNTGVEYQLYHGLGLILVGLMAYQFPQAKGLVVGGWLLLAGVVMFSGSLYGLALTGARWLGPVTPLGGLAFIVGWGWIGWSVLRAS
ncbi:DUF423 domain-containing protein [Ketobacter sp. MCCC 1A13808]|uniref:DUF423 domain-containing protein n=1 Tax=Ketobacter sp. MCCC 1A13808 TaxID=2602738 RepID=UPI000F2B08F0|nr:DUF423 domain-containing protein [Ketobacter sp. MCCC 1A13808]MVF13687.1 DUF423 domain-containing protein [Ketobacter sp. MCCC 1A13808]RLP52617.1 MAG: DUF423 domain-containing protein [Ketobacter sp.]